MGFYDIDDDIGGIDMVYKDSDSFTYQLASEEGNPKIKIDYTIENNGFIAVPDFSEENVNELKSVLNKIFGKNWGNLPR